MGLQHARGVVGRGTAAKFSALPARLPLPGGRRPLRGRGLLGLRALHPPPLRRLRADVGGHHGDPDGALPPGPGARAAELSCLWPLLCGHLSLASLASIAWAGRRAGAGCSARRACAFSARRGGGRARRRVQERTARAPPSSAEHLPPCCTLSAPSAQRPGPVCAPPVRALSLAGQRRGS